MVKKVTKIKETNNRLQKKLKLRVAAYARVSTDNTEQLISLEAQKVHYEAYIKANPDWEFVGIYFDEGISGTKKENRTELLRLISDCENKKIDFVITKSISRFARNTIDCLEIVRKLTDLGVFIYFEKENINTQSMESELMLTILSSLAENESISISENNKWSIQKRFRNGTYKLSYPPYGYDYIDGQIVVNKKQAEVVKRIFTDALAGKGTQKIAQELNDEGVRTKKGGQWRGSTIRGILRNEKYTGDALLQKTYTVDFLSKKRVVNNGIVPQYYVENSHEPIIPRGIFMQVQEELVRRANLYTGKNGKKRVYSSKYALSSIVYCSECGEIYRRVHWNNRGCRSIVWRCVSRLEEKGSDCTSPTVNEEVLQAAVVKAINELLASKDTFLSTLQANIETVLNEEHDKITNDIDVKLEELQNELLRLANSKTDYEEVAEEIYRLREQKQNALVENAEREGKRQRIAEMTDFLNEQSCELEEYDEQLVRRLIEKVTIYEDKLTVEFKSGIEIDEEI